MFCLISVTKLALANCGLSGPADSWDGGHRACRKHGNVHNTALKKISVIRGKPDLF